MKTTGESANNLFKFISSAVIISLHTVFFCYILFCKYNRILTAPLATGGYLMVVLYIAALIFIFNVMGALKVGYNRWFNIILSQCLGLIMVDAVAYLQLSLINRAFLPVSFTILMCIGQISVAIIWTLTVFSFMQKHFPVKKLLLVYGDKKAESIVYKILEREDQYMLCESVKYNEFADHDTEIKRLEEKIKEYSSVVICQIESAVRNDLLKFCYENDIVVYIQPRISDMIVRGAKELNRFDSPLIVCKNCSLTLQQRIFKRICDVIISVIGLIITSPLMLIVSVAIKLYDRGPVIYKQKRVTLDEKVFDIYKFRSMIVNAEKEEKSIPASDNDPRITPIGKIIRKLRIDELPQLFNILKGDMSVVGPRPERVEHHEAYTKQIPEFPYRCKVKAGLTGYAQVMGKYNTTPYDKLLLDLSYIQQFSFFLDLKLILLTVKVIFMKESTEGFNKNKQGE